MAASRSEAATATASSGRSTAGTRSDDACGGVAAEAMTVAIRPPSLLLQMESMMMMTQWLSRVIDGASAGRMMHDDGHDVDVVAGEVRESDASGVVGAVDDVVAGVGSGDRHRPSNQ